MELTALIVDDEESSRNVLRALLKTHCPHVEVLDEASNTKDAYEKIVALNPAIVFLDIQMPGGNGISLLKKFTEVPFQVIFATSYDKYAIEAIKFSALYYLLKPIEVEELKEAVQKVVKTVTSQRAHSRQIYNVIFNMESTGLTKKLAFHDNDRVVFVSLDEILFFEGDANYTNIQTRNKKFISSKNLGKMEELLLEFPQFFRINRGCIINLNCVNEYAKGEPCIITLDKWHFEVSRRKKQDFLAKVKNQNDRY